MLVVSNASRFTFSPSGRDSSTLLDDQWDSFPLSRNVQHRPPICKLRILAVDLQSEAAKKTRHHCRAKVDGHYLRLSAQTSIAPIA